MTHRCRSTAVAASVALAAWLGAGCGSDDVDPAESRPVESLPVESTAPIESQPVQSQPVDSTVPGTDPPATLVEIVEIAEIVPDVAYYGACGNETVVVDGTTWYPLLPDEREAFDETPYPLEVVDPGQSGLLRVAPPGPGDDIGTLIVYVDGMARFQSESGRVIWLTSQERTYNWEC